jgi:hypothetical protein
MANKQTAVEWLVKELNNLHPDLILSLKTWDDINNLITESKQMEREQIMNAFSLGQDIATWDSEKYYNETYGNITD